MEKSEAILDSPPEAIEPLHGEEGREDQALVVGEIQLLLAEKRTSLAALRTGIAVFVLPLSVLSILIATSRYYDLIRVLHFVIPLLLLCVALVLLGSYLILRSLSRMHHEEKMIRKIKSRYPRIAEFID